MTKVNKYRVWCEVELKYVETWSIEEPTTCPLNHTHSIDTSKTSIIETITNESGNREFLVSWDKLKEIESLIHICIKQYEYNDYYYIYGYSDITNTTYYLNMEKSDPKSEHQIDFETNYKDKCKEPYQRDGRGRPITIPGFRSGSKITMVSHNYCDKTTWWMGADKILDETLTDSGDGLTFNFANDYLINLDRVSMRDQVKSYGYMDIVNYNETTGRFSCINVYVDGNKITTGFTINHESGSITFDNNYAGHTIKADYYKANSSKFTIAPFPGKILRLIETEVQTSIGAQMDDVFKFTIKAGGQVVHQQHYNSARDYLDASNLAYKSSPFLELTKDVVIIPWNYPITIDLKSSLGMTLDLELLQNIPITNSEINTITFYFVVETEL